MAITMKKMVRLLLLRTRRRPSSQSVQALVHAVPGVSLAARVAPRAETDMRAMRRPETR